MSLIALPALAQAPEGQPAPAAQPPAAAPSVEPVPIAEPAPPPPLAEPAPAVTEPAPPPPVVAPAPAPQEPAPAIGDEDHAPAALPPRGPQSARGAPGFRLGLGIQFDAVDQRAIQGLRAPVPQFTLETRYQFDNKISIFTQFQFIFIMNQLELGAGWSGRIGKTDIMPYFTAGAMLGTLSLGGFDSFTAAPVLRPGIRLGWDVAGYDLTFNGSALFIPAQYVTLGASDLWTSEFRAFTGLQGTLALDVPLSGGDSIFFGFGLLWTRAWYQTWLFYSDDPSLLLYPRVFIGYVF
ncbi:MAG TPA: hypothetical protein VJV78_36540 [Polyangiales bacterium]|nr:hypothetical protein [Polyangiales bacterium]